MVCNAEYVSSIIVFHSLQGLYRRFFDNRVFKFLIQANREESNPKCREAPTHRTPSRQRKPGPKGKKRTKKYVQGPSQIKGDHHTSCTGMSLMSGPGGTDILKGQKREMVFLIISLYPRYRIRGLKIFRFLSNFGFF
jgi:hypothetical protein